MNFTWRAPLLFLALTEWLSPGVSAVVLAHEERLDNIFGKQNFRPGAAIDIVINPTEQAVGLSNVHSREDLLGVMALAPNTFPTVNLYLVDNIDWCGFVFANDIVGCSSASRNAIVLESEAVEAMMGTELIAHELGHVLDLRHIDGDSNLMNPSLNDNTTLTADQISTINASPLVVGLDPNRFIRITPIVVHAIPEPSVSTSLFMAFIGWMARRRRNGGRFSRT